MSLFSCSVIVSRVIPKWRFSHRQKWTTTKKTRRKQQRNDQAQHSLSLSLALSFYFMYCLCDYYVYINITVVTFYAFLFLCKHRIVQFLTHFWLQTLKFRAALKYVYYFYSSSEQFQRCDIQLDDEKCLLVTREIEEKKFFHSAENSINFIVFSR